MQAVAGANAAAASVGWFGFGGAAAAQAAAVAAAAQGAAVAAGTGAAVAGAAAGVAAAPALVANAKGSPKKSGVLDALSMKQWWSCCGCFDADAPHCCTCGFEWHKRNRECRGPDLHNANH
jgi:hypothetical protein